MFSLLLLTFIFLFLILNLINLIDVIDSFGAPTESERVEAKYPVGTKIKTKYNREGVITKYLHGDYIWYIEVIYDGEIPDIINEAYIVSTYNTNKYLNKVRRLKNGN